jgi:hypothetical protein
MKQPHVHAVAEYLQFLRPSFPHSAGPSRAYDHLGALLADLALQAGMNYDHVVRPRVNSILVRFPKTKVLTGLRIAIGEVGAEAYLQWRGQEKIGLFQALLGLMRGNGLETVEDLSLWCVCGDTKATLLSLPRFGPKSFDYLRLLCGVESIPLDRHIVRFLQLTGLDCPSMEYAEMQEILLAACRLISLEPYKAERGLWLLMRSCSPG